MVLIFGGAGVIAIVAGVITAVAITSNRNDDSPPRWLVATVEAQAGTANAKSATESATYMMKLGTPIPVDSLHPVTLMFCEPLREPGGGTRIAVIDSGAQVSYALGGCQPDVDASGAVAVRNKDGSASRVTPTYADPRRVFPRDNVVWTPAKGTLNGAQVIMTGRYLKRDASVEFDSLDAPTLLFHMTSDGQHVFGSMSERLIGYPVATFVDGVPVRGEYGELLAPTIQARITDSGQTTGLTLEVAKLMAALIDNGLAQ